MSKIIKLGMAFDSSNAPNFGGSVAKKLIKQNRCVIIKKKYWS